MQRLGHTLSLPHGPTGDAYHLRVSTPPDADVARSTVVVGSDPGRVALAGVLSRLSARHWVDVLVPAALVLALEWLLGMPLVVGLLLAVATAAVIVTVRIRKARRSFMRSFPIGERLAVTAEAGGLGVARGDEAPVVEVWSTFDRAALVRDHLVVGRRRSQEQLVLPASVSDAALLAAVRAGIGRATGNPMLARSDDSAATPTARDVADPARSTTVEIDDATVDRMARDFTVESLTGVRTMLLLGLLAALSVAVKFSASATTRLVLPTVTLLLIALVVGGGYLGTRRMLRRSPRGRVSLSFDAEGFTTTSAAGTTHTPYRDVTAVTVRGETVMVRGHGGAVALHPRALVPDPLLAALRAGMPTR